MADSDIRVVRAAKFSATCDKCKHYQRDAKCDAFPDGVPTEIILGYVSHIHPFEGDQGIRFEPMHPRNENRKGKKKTGY